jgi:kinase-associated protein B
MNEQRQPAAIGDLVQFTYKTGTYAGRVAELGSPRCVVEALAVLRHPDQGDLHHPYDPDVPMFHERRALSHREKALVLHRDMEPFRGGEVPEYKESLAAAVRRSQSELERLERWAARARETLQDVSKDYGL